MPVQGIRREPLHDFVGRLSADNQKNVGRALQRTSEDDKTVPVGGSS